MDEIKKVIEALDRIISSQSLVLAGIKELIALRDSASMALADGLIQERKMLYDANEDFYNSRFADDIP